MRRAFHRGCCVVLELAVGVYSFEIVVLRLDCSRVTVQLRSLSRALGEQGEELLEMVDVSGVFLPTFIREVVVPDRSVAARGEEEKVGLDARAGVDERAGRQRDDAPESQPSSSLRLVWTKAFSLVRNSTPSSSTIPQRPPGLDGR